MPDKKFSPEDRVDARFRAGAVGQTSPQGGGGISGARVDVPLNEGKQTFSAGVRQPFYTADNRPHRAGPPEVHARVSGEIPLTRRQQENAENHRQLMAAQRLLDTRTASSEQ